MHLAVRRCSLPHVRPTHYQHMSRYLLETPDATVEDEDFMIRQAKAGVDMPWIHQRIHLSGNYYDTSG